jgi:hypothetical protein
LIRLAVRAPAGAAEQVLAALLELAEEGDRGSLCDLGCGSGVLAQGLLDDVPVGVGDDHQPQACLLGAREGSDRVREGLPGLHRPLQGIPIPRVPPVATLSPHVRRELLSTSR